jgi:NitT/TauT family transport system ATP-binding protein
VSGQAEAVRSGSGAAHVDTLIRIKSVSKVFRGGKRIGVHALDDIDLEIGENEFVVLVGRSGCGKSTLLRIVAGLLGATQGSVSIGEETVRGPRPDVSMMFQRPALMPWRSVIDNVMLPVEVLRLDKHQYRSTAERLLTLTGLDEFAASRPHELSGGMQQRVALCRALIHDPAVLLMDEPFAALDALTREDLSLELQRIWSEHQKTILFVTHSIQEALLLADRIVVMTPRPGRIAEILELKTPRPRTLGVGATDEITKVSAQLYELLFSRELKARAEAARGA